MGMCDAATPAASAMKGVYMIHSLGRRARIVGVGIASLGLGLTGVLASASAPASASARAVHPHPVGGPPLDHMLCYHVRATGFKPITGVLLKNFIQPNPFMPKVGSVATHCNPATKVVRLVTGGVNTYKMQNPNAHLLCWTISFQFQSVPVNISNQFGKAIMMTSPGPKSLCLPTWKKRTGPPGMKLVQPPRLDHFTCYGLSVIKGQYGFKIPLSVKVQDEFNMPKFTTLKLGIADTLCVPTTKVYHNAVYPPQSQNDLSLVCFPSSKTPYWKSFWDQNQFGTGKVFPTKPTLATTPFEELCLPTTAIIG